MLTNNQPTVEELQQQAIQISQEIDQLHEAALPLEMEIRRRTPANVLAAVDWLSSVNRVHIVNRIIEQVISDNQFLNTKNILENAIQESKICPTKILSGLVQEITLYLEVIYYYLLCNYSSLIEDLAQPLYLSAVVHIHMLSVVGAIAIEELGDNGQQIQDAIKILVTNLSKE